MALSTAIDASAVARTTGIKAEFVNLRGGALYLPQQIMIVGQGNSTAVYSNDIFQITSAAQAGSRYGFGSPIHLAARKLFPPFGGGVGTIPVYVLPLDDDGSGVAASGTITPATVSTTIDSYQVVVNNVASEKFVIDSDDSKSDIVTKVSDAINANINIPVVATADVSAGAEKVDVLAKWKGLSGNDIFISVEKTSGIDFTIVQPTGGLVNPSLTAPLSTLGTDRWYTMLLNCLNFDDTAALDALKTVGDGRWDAQVNKPFIAFHGNTSTTVAAATAETKTRTTDYVNSQLVSPASKDLPFVVAAAQLAKIAVLANNNPPHDYGRQVATGLVPGTAASQWDYTKRNQAVLAGSSTVEIRNGEVNVSDVVTPYSPEGEEPPAYRFVVDIIKLMNAIFNVDLEFNTAKWDGAPLIPNDQPTTNPDAKTPADAIAAAAAIVDALADEAIISDPATAKENIRAEISSTNPKRLNMIIPVRLSGNVNIKSIDLQFGFYFG